MDHPHHLSAHEPLFVLLSILIAVTGSWTALDLFRRVRATSGQARFRWLMATALTTGLSIWSMHFVAMLGFDPGVPVRYDLGLTAVSMAAATAGTAFAFLCAVSSWAKRFSLVIASTVMGAGIFVMHYLGMAAVSGAFRISYDPALVGLSFGIAVVASAAALFAVRVERALIWRAAGAVALGLAIVGMHFTGMAAADFSVLQGAEISAVGVEQKVFAATVAGVTLLLLVLALAAAGVDRRFANVRHSRQAARLAVLCSFGVAALLIGGLVAEGVRFDHARQSAGRHMAAAQQVANRIVLADEQLAMSARLAAETGAERWVHRYKAQLKGLEADIERASGLTAPGGGERFKKATEPAVAELSAIEGQAMELGLQGRSEEARQLLDASRYEMLRGALIDATGELVAEIRAAGELRIERVRTENRAATGAILLLALIVSAVLWRVLNSYLSRAEAAHEAAQRSIRELELAALKQASKDEVVGQLAGGIAHDFNNLLAVVIGSLDLIEMDLPPDSQSREQVDAALAASLRGAELTHQLLAFARKQPLMAREVDLNASVRAFSGDLRRMVGPEIILDVKYEQDEVLAKTDPAQLDKALKNLVMNAAEAMPSGGRVMVEVGPDRRPATQDAAPKYACISVSDEGCGVPADQLASVFEPFFSTKPTGAGGGLGLSMVHGFVKQSGGEIEFVSQEGAGTTVRLYFPTPERSAGQRSLTPGASRDSRSRRLVLVVDDDASVRASVVAQLSSLGYETVEAADGAEALQRVAEVPDIDLVFTDILMPGMNGVELGREIAVRRPDLRVLYTSGFVGGSASDGSDLPVERFLAKPYRKHDLKLKMDQILAAA